MHSIVGTPQRGPLHGYGITLQILPVTGSELRVEEGSLYPALHRLEKRGYLESEWRATDTGRKAKFYKLTAAGRKQLAVEREGWKRMSRLIFKVLDAKE